MSKQLPAHDSDDDHQPSSGPNLVLIYSLMALGFLVAIGIAILIVMPYYLHR